MWRWRCASTNTAHLLVDLGGANGARAFSLNSARWTLLPLFCVYYLEDKLPVPVCQAHSAPWKVKCCERVVMRKGRWLFVLTEAGYD